jgi:hypothetical protein
MKNIIIFLIAIFFTQNLYASDSIVYDVYKDLINIIKQFSLNIHSGLILIYSKSYFLICAIASPLVLYAYGRNKIDFDNLIAYFLFLLISVALVVNKVYFMDIIYNPYMNILKKSIAWVMTYSGDITFVKVNSLADLFANIYNATDRYTSRLDKVTELPFGSIWDGIVSITQFITFFFNIMLLKAMFFLTSLIFIVKFTMIILYIHIVIVFLPISISLFPFRSLRPYTFVNFKLLLTFLLNIMIQAIGISIILYSLNTLNAVETIGSYQTGVGLTFFWSSIITSAMGGLTIITSGHLSSLILSAMGLPPSVSSRAISMGKSGFSYAKGYAQSRGIIAGNMINQARTTREGFKKANISKLREMKKVRNRNRGV